MRVYDFVVAGFAAVGQFIVLFQDFQIPANLDQYPLLIFFGYIVWRGANMFSEQNAKWRDALNENNEQWRKYIMENETRLYEYFDRTIERVSSHQEQTFGEALERVVSARMTDYRGDNEQ